MGAYTTKALAPWDAYKPVILTVVIEDGVTNIGTCAFYALDKLQKVELGADIATIEKYAFFQCGKVWNVTIPESVTKIDKYAFRKAWGAKQIFFENVFGWSAGTESLAAVTLNTPTEAANLLKNTQYLKVWTRDVNAEQILDPNLISGGSCGETVKWTFDKFGVLRIFGTGAMTNYTSSSVTPWAAHKNDIVKIVIEDGVTTIGEFAFSVADGAADADKYSSLTEVQIADSVETIGKYAFQGCSTLKSITIPAGVTTIGQRAFRKCGITSVIFTDAEGWIAGTTALDLTNATTAATMLKNTYSASNWVKG